VLELVDLPTPSPGKNQLLLKVVASAVNPVDWKRASGKLRFLIPATFPATPGFDIAGEVIAVGEGVTQFTPGMRVHARSQEGSGGGCAEFAVVNINVSAKIPEGMSYAEAAGLPLAGMTALQGLRDEAKVRSGERAMIVGASGGVGHLAVQIAKAMGLYTVAVCSARNADVVRGLGADEVVDYQKEGAFAAQRDLDVIYDCVAGDPSPWLPMLKSSGRYVSCMPSPKTFLRGFINVVASKRVRPVMLKSNASDLEWLNQLVEKRQLKVLLDQRFGLEDTRKAWERSLSGRAAGKIIIDVAP
jgi:NADPH:quinone reductase-like Zn-dependent oxidoreductase